ncbi:nuclear transport factor 2 family protein [Sphingomonas glacialis]|uniref:Nuclear transport factor 2 family protein n=1 Tax=Sphingomonas glacialis TaxID=658225 RepID=A0A502FY73_9SPHN|nr:nuclear transport factor 2 family protein [Sphingomonas glacialis]TPG54290.1 nuclear transport factor 2 family protein [Sphingomonas glacialis]
MAFSGPSKPARRTLLAGAALLGATATIPFGARAARPGTPLDRAAYQRYLALMNAADPRFLDFYADDVRFVMNIRGRDNVAKFYAAQRPYIQETLELLFFCSDASGAAAQVISEVRCIADHDDRVLFGRPLKKGEVQRIRGCLLYVLDDHGRIAEISGPPPEVLEPWHMATS